jgi:hypothetical protein
VTAEANLKASLIATVLHVGVNYNRYHVSDVLLRCYKQTSQTPMR